MGKIITTKFQIGEEVALLNPSYGQDATFVIGMIHIERHDTMGFYSSELIYSSGFYDYGFPESRLSHFKRGFDIEGELMIIPYTKKNRWEEFKAKCRYLFSKFKRKQNERS